MPNIFLHLIVSFLIGSAVFLAGYLFTGKNNPANQGAFIDNSLIARFEKTEEKRVAPTGLFELTSGEASFPTVSVTGELLYYVPKNGEIRSISIKNITAGSTLVARIQPNADNITWGTDKNLVAVFSTGSIFFDLASNYSKKYDSQIKNQALNKLGNKIAYTYFDEESGGGNVRIADPKLESYKNILPTRFSGWQIHWLDDNRLALIKPPTLENTASSLYVLGIENGALQNILDLKNNLEFVLSGSGQKLIYSYVSSETQEKGLYFMDLANNTEIALNSSLNASRCVWSIDNKTIYCADKDSFVSFDTSAPDAQPKEVISSGLSANAVDLILNSTEDYLIFKNSQDGKLYGLSLSN